MTMKLNPSASHGSTRSMYYDLHRHPLAPGDDTSVRVGLAQLAGVVREHPYCDRVEEAIFFIALGHCGLPPEARNPSSRGVTLDFLRYLAEGYVPADEGEPTAGSNVSRDSNLASNGRQSLSGASFTPLHREGPADFPSDATENASNPERRRPGAKGVGTRLHVEGIPAWAVYFLLAVFALREGDSGQALGAMENAFLSYEIWLPR